jgi:YD repeat-containing protein
MFTIDAETDLSTTTSFLHGSGIAYERVTVKQKDAGWSVYEFDLPASFGDASANSNEWVASKVLIARQPTGNAACFETPNIPGGINHYPFPPNPNYDFAKGLMKKATDFREDGVKVREVTYNHQRVYGNGSSIRKIYGLALEELPTYYYTGSAYVDGKMFLFSKYELFTDVKTVLSSETEIVYNTPDLVQKTETVKSYFYDSPNHRELSRAVVLNSDGSQTVSRFKYVQDYTISSTSNPAATAIVNLKNAFRLFPVETTVSRIVDGTEKYIKGDVTIFQTIGSQVFPDKQYSFVSVSGSTTFVPSYINASNVFRFDPNHYVLKQQYLSFDSYGNPIDVMGRDRDVRSVVYGYNGTLPLVKVAHARANEFRYSTFDTDVSGSSTSFYPSVSFPACVGRYNSVGITLPGGSANKLNGSISTNKSNWFVFSFWAKATSAGTMNLTMGAGNGDINITVPFTASADWKYYTVKQPIGTMLGNPSGFWIQVWSNVAVNLDDVAFYPEHADIVAYTYRLPFGKSSETSSQGISYSYEYDLAGRPRAIYDRDKNILKKYDYQVRPY